MESRSLISLDSGKTWIETREQPHQDGTRDMGPIIAVQRVSDSTYLRANSLGDLDWATKSENDPPGADERWITVPGAYVGIRENNVVVMRAGSWSQ